MALKLRGNNYKINKIGCAGIHLSNLTQSGHVRPVKMRKGLTEPGNRAGSYMMGFQVISAMYNMVLKIYAHVIEL
jgi:hypothetical protein